jgi:HD-like signal output (HDOD) protein
MGLWQRLWDYFRGAADDAAPTAERPAALDAAAAPAPAAPADAPADATAADVWWAARPAGGAAPEPADEGDPEALEQLHDGLYRELGALVDDPNPDLPRLPHVTERAMVMLGSVDVDYRALAGVVSEDPALTAQVLRVANSALYGGVQQVRSLELAFARLGQRTVRGTIMSATLRALSIRLEGSGPRRTLGEDIWRRALASGVAMSTLAPPCGRDPDEAFLHGLLHDMGLWLVLLVVHRHTQRTGARVPRSVFERLAAEWHEHAGRRLSEAWNLPAPLPDLIMSHHKLPAADDRLAPERCLIMTGDACCALLGYGPYQPYDLFQLPCVQRLGLADTPDVHTLLRGLPERIAERMGV